MCVGGVCGCGGVWVGGWVGVGVYVCVQKSKKKEKMWCVCVWGGGVSRREVNFPN